MGLRDIDWTAVFGVSFIILTAPFLLGGLGYSIYHDMYLVEIPAWEYKEINQWRDISPSIQKEINVAMEDKMINKVEYDRIRIAFLDADKEKLKSGLVVAEKE